MHKDIANYLLNWRRAAERGGGVPVEISTNEVVRLLVPMTCSASGVRLEWNGRQAKGDRRPFEPFLDTVDDDRGYVSGNVRVVCLAYGLARANASHADMVRMARGIVEREDEWLK